MNQLEMYCTGLSQLDLIPTSIKYCYTNKHTATSLLRPNLEEQLTNSAYRIRPIISLGMLQCKKEGYNSVMR